MNATTHASGLPITQLGSTIKSHLGIAEKYEGKADEHYKSAGIHLLEAKARIAAAMRDQQQHGESAEGIERYQPLGSRPRLAGRAHLYWLHRDCAHGFRFYSKSRIDYELQYAKNPGE